QPDSSQYESFFEQVLHIGNYDGPVMINGEPTTFTQPVVQEVLGLTAEQARELQEIAATCTDRVAPIAEQSDPLRHQAMFEELSEAADRPISRRRAALEQRRNEIIAESVNRLRAILSE